MADKWQTGGKQVRKTSARQVGGKWETSAGQVGDKWKTSGSQVGDK